MEVWELKLYFYPSAGGLKKKEKKIKRGVGGIYGRFHKNPVNFFGKKVTEEKVEKKWCPRKRVDESHANHV